MKAYHDFLYRLLRRRKVMVVGLFNDELSDVQCLSVEDKKGEVERVEFNKFDSINQFRLWYNGQKMDLPIVLLVANHSTQLGVGAWDSKTINPEEFLIEGGVEDRIFAFARVSQLEGYLFEFKELKNSIVSVFIGPIQAFSWAYRLKEFSDQSIGCYRMTLSEKTILEEQEPGSSRITWNERSFVPNELLLYLTSFEYFLGGLHQKIVSVSQSGIEFTFRTLFKKLTLYGGVIYFVLLLCSAILFLKFDADRTELEVTHRDQEAIRGRIEKYRVDINKMKSILEISSERPILTQYAVGVGSDVPKSVTLNHMHLLPIEKKSPSNRNAQLPSNWIVVSGEGDSITEISSWIGILKKNAWVKKILNQDIKKKDDKYLFELRLEVTND